MSHRGRVLVVEDDEIMRETLHEVLSVEGLDVRTAPNGRVALTHMEDWDPQVIVLDLMMPVMDAFAFRDEQRRIGVAPAARVLVLSAARDLDGAARRIGADRWIGKPFHLDEVIVSIEELLAAGSNGRTAAR